MQSWTGNLHEWQQQLSSATAVRPRYVITATSRLARRLRDELHNTLQTSNKILTPAPQIMDYSSWLQNLWSVLCWQTVKPLCLLTDIQIQQLWRRVLHTSDLDVLNSQAVIHLAIEAYQTLRVYRLEDHEWQSFASGDARWFKHAYRQYQIQLHQHDYLDPADLATTLITANLSDYLRDVDIDWIGFIEYTPEQLFLMQSLSGAYHRHIQWQVPAQSNERITCTNTLQEFQQALSWAFEIIKSSATSKVAIVVPELQNDRTQWRREILRWPQQFSEQISFSGGEPLAQLPLFKTVFSGLSLLQTPWQLQDVLRLCRSTFLSEVLTLPELLHTQLPLNGSPEQFQRCLKEQGLKPAWLTILQPQINQVITPRTLPQWCEFAQQLLAQLQWPGALVLNSVDYQATQKIAQLWLQVGSADPLHKSWQLSDFLALLQQQAQQCLFQAESLATPIQILGLWESIGQTFDGLWVMGLHQDAWPRGTRLSPFLPRELQIAQQLPRACPQKEWQLAQQILQQWQQSAAQLVFSFAQQEGAAHQAPSPLIMNFPQRTLSVFVLPASSLNLESVQQALPMVIAADENPRGGSAILASQAQCAFQAFARFRLRVKPMEDMVLGLSAQARGILVHNCLESFWRLHQHQAALKALTEQQLHKQLNDIIDQQLKQRPLKQSAALNTALITAEKQRLLNLLTQWLTMEKLRTPFKVIALEQAIEVQLAGLHLSVRLDRMDQLESGESLLIDYKTGAVNLQDWWHQPCLAPQLPLYALTVSPRADAIVYGVVALTKPMLKGLGTAALQVYDQAPRHLQQALDALENWSDLQARWQQDIHQLAEDFCQGAAHLQPINGDVTCGRCGLQSLCRVDSFI